MKHFLLSISFIFAIAIVLAQPTWKNISDTRSVGTILPAGDKL